MARWQPRTHPDHDNPGWPPGVPFIIGNEGCERFSFYGMRSILTLYMADVLYKSHPAFKSAPGSFATAHYHLFVAAVYALPMIGAILADRLLGKYARSSGFRSSTPLGKACSRSVPARSGGFGRARADRGGLWRDQAVRLGERRRSVRAPQLAPSAQHLSGVLLHHQLRQLLRDAAHPLDLEATRRQRSPSGSRAC